VTEVSWPYLPILQSSTLAKHICLTLLSHSEVELLLLCYVMLWRFESTCQSNVGALNAGHMSAYLRRRCWCGDAKLLLWGDNQGLGLGLGGDGLEVMMVIVVMTQGLSLTEATARGL
jgi:hypothetical protein